MFVHQVSLGRGDTVFNDVSGIQAGLGESRCKYNNVSTFRQAYVTIICY